jgi:hypothetical protein
MSLDWNELKTKEALRQHNFAQFCFTQTFPVLDPGTFGLQRH